MSKLHAIVDLMQRSLQLCTSNTKDKPVKETEVLYLKMHLTRGRGQAIAICHISFLAVCMHKNNINALEHSLYLVLNRMRVVCNT